MRDYSKVKEIAEERENIIYKFTKIINYVDHRRNVEHRHSESMEKKLGDIVDDLRKDLFKLHEYWNAKDMEELEGIMRILDKNKL